MAKSNGVWGIDIGQCALKALRCKIGDDGKSLVADAFDYIEYPKILSQPDANPTELVREALEQFLSRNEVRGDKVAMSVSGQAGLSRFFKPPPVDAKKMPDIVKYEARQQIPFALEDVIWDYQQLGGTEVDGFVMDAEIGLFAMKRDAVFRALKPFLDADVEIDYIQLAPLCIYNVITRDLLKDVPAPEDIDPENPPESLVVISLGTETTDLVVTNGIRIWQRSIPLGGNHFTKQLTKELKLTYAKAEHLKRNARQADDAKAIFQAMRPVFNDLVTEIQRSLGYFQSIDRQAKIGRMVMLGNASKLPGLRQYLAKNLGHDIVKLNSFESLTGANVVASPAFKDNVLSFGVCYGLCLQGVGQAKLSTNLLPREFFTQRLIRSKKPWVLAAVGALMLACAFHFFFRYAAWWEVNDNNTFGQGSNSKTWKQALEGVVQVKSTSGGYIKQDGDQVLLLEQLDAIGQEVVGNDDRRIQWLELLSAIDQTIPTDPRYPRGAILNPKDVPFLDRADLQIEYIETQYFKDLAMWYASGVQQRYLEEQRRLKEESPPAAASADGMTTPDGSVAAVEGEEVTGPTGEGWIVEIKGYHFHNSSSTLPNGMTGTYVRNTLLKNLRDMKVNLPGAAEPFTFKELGVDYAILAVDPELDRNYRIPNINHPQYGKGGSTSGMETSAFPSPMSSVASTVPGAKKDEPPKPEEPLDFPAPRYDFVVQFAWQPTLLTKRLEDRDKAEKARQAEAAAAQPPETAAQPSGNTVAGGAATTVSNKTGGN